MIKKIKSSLFAKVFLITLLFLLGISFLVYGLMAWLMPKTYSNQLNAQLDKKTRDFITGLERAAREDSGGLFDQFLQNEDIYSVELYAEDGLMVSLPTNQVSNEQSAGVEASNEALNEQSIDVEASNEALNEQSAGVEAVGEQGAGAEAAGEQDAGMYSTADNRSVAEAAGEQGSGMYSTADNRSVAEAVDEQGLGIEAEDGYEVSEAVYDSGGSSEDSPVLSGSYYFSFLGSDDRYMLMVYGSAGQIAQLRQSFLYILPVLSVVVVGTAFAAAGIYSHLITKPVLKISRISEKMSGLHLEWKLEENRSDELGILEKSLNELSHNLSTALLKLQNANQQLAQDIEREKKIEQSGLEFFSAVSHELKTPISAIKGQLEGMLLGVGAYKNHQKYLSRSLEIVNTLEIMVQEILTVSRLETEDGKIRKEEFDGVQMILRCLDGMEDLIVKKELNVECDLPDAALICGSKMLMEKVFSNLIGNAVKYSPQGGDVFIAVKMAENQFDFSIENSGAQIPQESIPKLFEAFYRVEQSRNRKTGGSGLGLYIVQKILQQHDSSCMVRNTPAGVRFSFTI